MIVARLNEQSTFVLTIVGQRSGSRTAAKNDCTAESEICESDGARNPLAYVPRTATMLLGMYFTPNLGTVEFPKSLYCSERIASCVSSPFRNGAESSA